jgi:hypothetical protein
VPLSARTVLPPLPGKPVWRPKAKAEARRLIRDAKRARVNVGPWTKGALLRVPRGERLLDYARWTKSHTHSSGGRHRGCLVTAGTVPQLETIDSALTTTRPGSRGRAERAPTGRGDTQQAQANAGSTRLLTLNPQGQELGIFRPRPSI